MPVVEVTYYTDPACPWSWALEPALRKLAYEFDGNLQITYVMCGMAREFGDPLKLVGEQLEAAAASGMPVDPRLWLDSPPRSSHPACIAVKAAAEQGDPARYLRRLREGLMCRRRKLDTVEALLDEAEGLDRERLRIGLGSHAVLEAFAADLEQCQRAAGPDADRVVLPTLALRGSDGGVHVVSGPADHDQLRAAALAAGAQPSAAAPPSVLEAVRRYGPLATPEVAALCELPGPRAPAELWRLAGEWLLTFERLGGGELWSAA